MGVPPKLQVLVVDDETSIAEPLGQFIESLGHDTLITFTANEALERSAGKDLDLIFLDLRLGATNGLDLVKDLIAEHPRAHIIVMTAYPKLEVAVSALKRGARDFLCKPFDLKDIESILDRVIDEKAVKRRAEELENQVVEDQILMESGNEKMQELLRLAKRVAQTDSVILLTGESGTGKTKLAKTIHNWSVRSSKPFGVVACPTLSEELLTSELFGHIKGAFTGAVSNNPGRIYSCDGGTLFLDEIGTLPFGLQSKLLRFLQDYTYERVGDCTTRKADVRVIAATNADLGDLVSKGIFREDLYYRVNVIELRVPALRERLEDIEALSNFILERLCLKHGRTPIRLTAAQVKFLKTLSWPGNIRELRNFLEHSLILSNEGEPIHLKEDRRILPGRREEGPTIGGRFSLEEIERAHIESILSATDSTERAAEILGINPSTIWRKRKSYQVSKGLEEKPVSAEVH